VDLKAGNCSFEKTLTIAFGAGLASSRANGGGGSRAGMRAVNPAFIPRNHRIEAVIEAAVERKDFAPFEELLLVLAKPFDDQAPFARYMDPPQPHERVCQTFCGT
jgi:uncharacterized protein YdiU (UPF0061 family)